MLQDDHSNTYPIHDHETEDYPDEEAMQQAMDEWLETYGMESRGTVTFQQWLEVINHYEDYYGTVVLTQPDRAALEPYFADNYNLEMSPKNFVDLIKAIRESRQKNFPVDDHRDNDTFPSQSVSPEPSTSATAFAVRQRSSNMLSYGPSRPRPLVRRRFGQDNEEDHDSVNTNDHSASEDHPSIPDNYDSSLRDEGIDQISSPQVGDRLSYNPRGMVADQAFHRKSNYLSHDIVESHEQDTLDDDQRSAEYDTTHVSQYKRQLQEAESDKAKLRRQVLDLQRQLRETTANYENMAIQQQNSMSRLQDQLNSMKQDMATQKSDISQYRAMEEDLQEQIADLHQQIRSYESDKLKQTQNYDKLREESAKKDEELSKLRKTITQKQEQLRSAEANFARATEEMNGLMQENKELRLLQRQMEDELENMHNIQKDCEDLQNENETLKSLIDRLKFDLDESRSRATTEQKGGKAKTLHLELSGGEQASEDGEEYDEIGEELLLEAKIKEALMVTEKLKDTEQERDDYKLKATSALRELDECKTSIDLSGYVTYELLIVQRQYLKSKEKLQRDNHVLQETIERLKKQFDKAKCDQETQTIIAAVMEQGIQHDEDHHPCVECISRSSGYEQLNEEVCKQSDMIQQIHLMARNSRYMGIGEEASSVITKQPGANFGKSDV
ncbi:hypothetical protein EC973_005568 [Apophysomyces ossiformis]|uniref:Uncharacterized protein n=1 Tax=Apophysomyces ossiformis TaxID=679940 RepID=A0A8H7BS13_9FUNG|nr:hypothetical protein EC973_005568 [Apophysomyces ossiformis]